MLEEPQPNTVQMVEETRQVLQGLRSALIELFGALEVDPASPQDVARRTGMNKNLTWKLSRVVGATDAFASLNHLPGQQGLALAIDAFEKAGAPATMLERARGAAARFAELIAEHADDREHLELTLESMGLMERETSAEGGRELAFRGNSMIWGVQVRTRVAINFFGPSRDDPDLADAVVVLGFVRFRRLRASAKWRLFAHGITDDAGKKPQFLYKFEDLEPGADVKQGGVLREFSSANAPALEVIQGGSPELEFFLPGGQVGNRSAFDLFRGYIVRNVPWYQMPGSEVGFCAASITVPVQDLVFDLVVHRDLRMPAPSVSAYGFPQGGPDNPSIQNAGYQIPMTERLQELVGSPPALATPLAPMLSRVADRVYTRMGWDRSKFRGHRLHVPHPAMSTRVVLQWPLPEGKR